MPQLFPEWNRLEQLLDAIKQRGVARLPAEEIIEFGQLYRRAAAELSLNQTHEANIERLNYLNDLVGRCYPHVYTAKRSPLPSVLRFFTSDFPRTLRRYSLFLLLATAISLLPAIIGFAITQHDRAIADQVLPADLLESSQAVAQRHHKKQDWLPKEERPTASSAIMTNNIRVSIGAFAGGMTAGIVTILMLIYNGLMLGIVAAAVYQDGFATAWNFWAFVAPHGVIELTAIFIAGAAGLMLAWAIINPGELPRRLAIREMGKPAITLVLGVASMLVVAGLIEGFFSPMNIAEEIKYLVAAVEGLLLLSYIMLAGRKTETTTADSAQTYQLFATEKSLNHTAGSK